MNDDGIKLEYDFGNLELFALKSMNQRFVEIIYVSGVFNNRRYESEIEIQLPLRVPSIELVTAFIAWGIDKQIGEDFNPLTPTAWFERGRNSFDLLPWVKSQKLYDERPKCLVDRDWLKLAIRDLLLLHENLEENDSIVITFQKGVFSITSHLKVIAFPATGKDWEEQYEISAVNFANFPKRLKYKQIEISVWKDMFCLASYRYPIFVRISNSVK